MYMYIYIYTQIIYTHTAEPQETEEGLGGRGRWDDSPPISLTCTPLRQSSIGDGRD